jgi:AcrR family transcriptional regulator
MALTRDRIVDAGLALADTHGLGAVSMRRVAGELGVKAMSLYNHIAGKDALLDGMLERVLDEVTLPVAGRDWEEELRRCALSLHDAIRRHPWACGLAMAPAAFPSALGARARYIEAILRTLREAGFTAEQAYHGYHALDGHTIGITTWELGHTVADQSRTRDGKSPPATTPTCWSMRASTKPAIRAHSRSDSTSSSTACDAHTSLDERRPREPGELGDFMNEPTGVL